jgi:hypothetical protein
MIAVVSLVILFIAVCFAARTKEAPLDREAVRRIRSFAEQSRREELLPFE